MLAHFYKMCNPSYDCLSSYMRGSRIWSTWKMSNYRNISTGAHLWRLTNLMSNTLTNHSNSSLTSPGRSAFSQGVSVVGHRNILILRLESILEIGWTYKWQANWVGVRSVRSVELQGEVERWGGETSPSSNFSLGHLLQFKGSGGKGQRPVGRIHHPQYPPDTLTG